jgi:hypothetical protein
LREVSPDLLTMVEAGFPILTLPDVRKHFDELGMVPMGISPAQFGAAIASETPLSAAPAGGWRTLGAVFLALIPIPSDYQPACQVCWLGQPIALKREGVRYANRCSASESGL